MKNISFVFLLFLNLLFSTSTSFAQDLIYANEEENIYLQSNQPQNTAVQRTASQTVNGNLSGVYEGSRLSCPYAFERDLYVGITGEDVRLLQVLLNSDSRTMIALDGPGSKGKETNSFGESTKTAVKKFQSLFIEYIGIANGRFGPRTRTTMNAICNGQNTAKSGQVFNNVTSVQKDATPAGEVTVIPNDKISPRVSLSANLNSVEPSATFKVVANFSEEVKPISVESIIVDGGSVKEIRKLSKTSYAITITPNENTKNSLVQVEADKISDLAGNLNENASNEITVQLRSTNLANTINPNTNPQTNNPNPTQPTCNYDNQGRLILINPNTGSPVNTNGCPLTKSNPDNTAAFNSKLGCYADTGPLPQGITDVQRCSHPQNPNNPNSPCSSAYQQQWISQQKQILSSGSNYGYYAPPQIQQNPCQNGQIAASSQAAVQKGVAQNRQAAQQQAQQNAQSSQIGQMIGNLLRGGGLGGLNNRNGNTGPTGPSGPDVPWTDPDAKDKPGQTTSTNITKSADGRCFENEKNTSGGMQSRKEVDCLQIPENVDPCKEKNGGIISVGCGLAKNITAASTQQKNNEPGIPEVARANSDLKSCSYIRKNSESCLPYSGLGLRVPLISTEMKDAELTTRQFLLLIPESMISKGFFDTAGISEGSCDIVKNRIEKYGDSTICYKSYEDCLKRENPLNKSMESYKYKNPNDKITWSKGQCITQGVK